MLIEQSAIVAELSHISVDVPGLPLRQLLLLTKRQRPDAGDGSSDWSTVAATVAIGCGFRRNRHVNDTADQRCQRLPCGAQGRLRVVDQVGLVLLEQLP